VTVLRIGTVWLVIVALLFLGVATPAPVQAVQPDEILKDSALELRARNLSRELRCVVCQNQSIDDSDAPLARDLRLLVRERLVAGDSDGQVVEFVVSRYGEFVLLNPRFGPHTVLLWLAPLLLLVCGLFLARSAIVSRSPEKVSADNVTGLSGDEEEKLRRILEQDSSGSGDNSGR